MSTHSDPDQQAAEEVVGADDIKKAAQGAQAAVDLLVKTVLDIKLKVDALIESKYEFKPFTFYGEAGTLLDPEQLANDIGKEGWMLLDVPAAGSVDHPKGLIDTKTGKPFQIPAVLLFAYRRVPQS